MRIKGIRGELDPALRTLNGVAELSAFETLRGNGVLEEIRYDGLQYDSVHCGSGDGRRLVAEDAEASEGKSLPLLGPLIRLAHLGEECTNVATE